MCRATARAAQTRAAVDRTRTAYRTCTGERITNWEGDRRADRASRPQRGISVGTSDTGHRPARVRREARSGRSFPGNRENMKRKSVRIISDLLFNSWCFADMQTMFDPEFEHIAQGPKDDFRSTRSGFAKYPRLIAYIQLYELKT